ncbi:MAG: Uma2 family endonuclease [Cyanobacteria bacterium P01_H01_bin.121]
MIQAPTRYISQADYEQLCLEHPDRTIERTAQGELVEVAPVGGQGSRQEGSLYFEVELWNRQTELGYTTGSSGGYRLPLGSTRAPDIAWTRRERWDALSELEQVKFPPICPDFVIELRSQSVSKENKIVPQPLAELRAKMTEYLASGLRLGWLINPQDQQVEIYRAGQPVEIVAMPTTLSGEDVLPGLELQV